MKDYRFCLIAVGVIERNDKVLLGKKRKGPHAINLGDKWFFPGGRFEFGKDKTVEEALAREIKEETSLNIVIKDFIDFSVIKSNFEGVRVYACQCYYTVCPNDGEASPSDDLVELKWVNKEKVLSFIPNDIKKIIPKGVINYLK